MNKNSKNRVAIKEENFYTDNLMKSQREEHNLAVRE
jgi:hypothetical protein